MVSVAGSKADRRQGTCSKLFIYSLWFQNIFTGINYYNKDVRAKTQQAIGPHENQLTTEKRRKMNWYGHVSCSSGLAKTILQSTAKGGKRQGRQEKRWENNIMEWTCLEFAKSQTAV